MGDIKTTEFDLETTISDNDELLANISGGTARIPFKNIKSILSAWSNIISKPFDALDSVYLITKQDGQSAILTLSDNTIATLNNVGVFASDIQALKTVSHSHGNKETIDKFGTNSEGKLTWNSITVGSDYTLPVATDSTLGGVKVDGTTITVDSDGTIHGSSSYELPIASNTTLGGVKVDGTSITINSDGVISSAAQGLDFNALTSAMTTGTLSGINITADSENERFNFEVTGIPIIAIDVDGYWTINGERGDNPTKAQGEKGENGTDGTNGKDGASPTIDPITKNWIVGTVDTGVKAEAQSNYFYTGTEFPISDLIDGDLYLSFAEDTRGNVYQYQGTTLDWALQGNLYGGGAVIDDTSTTGNTVTWSASKINSVIGNINTILASVTGGIS